MKKLTLTPAQEERAQALHSECLMIDAQNAVYRAKKLA